MKSIERLRLISVRFKSVDFVHAERRRLVRIFISVYIRVLQETNSSIINFNPQKSSVYKSQS
ncbi:hypothetical protein DLM77_00315 [Leptospira yasudae]|uniref:Uncharacterized protein n=1 Tax=Leptospira yasudae TaxID=2202201 RepID=A0ABX9M788_9LEPT|nr:hypothetical protein DLM77_00315 [Leptospira yasudae]